MGGGSGVGAVEGEGDGEEGELVVSIVSVSELLESSPSLLVLPEESEKAALPTEITASEVLLSVGVKVAV